MDFKKGYVPFWFSEWDGKNSGYIESLKFRHFKTCLTGMDGSTPLIKLKNFLSAFSYSIWYSKGFLSKPTDVNGKLNNSRHLTVI
ncbi:hypothetical protein DSECCO2_247670 [anaerobic digester metagenome]